MSLADIQARMLTACTAAGRQVSDVNLIAVSKVQPDARVAAVLDQGHRIFGENKVQEAAGKWPAFRAQYQGVAVHLIGPLQTNKTRQAMELFDAIHTVDRPKLATALARLAQDMAERPDFHFARVEIARLDDELIEFRQFAHSPRTAHVH